jgi:hypothetical protein
MITSGSSYFSSSSSVSSPVVAVSSPVVAVSELVDFFYGAFIPDPVKMQL